MDTKIDIKPRRILIMRMQCRRAHLTRRIGRATGHRCALFATKTSPIAQSQRANAGVYILHIQRAS